MPLETIDPAYPNVIPENNLRLPDAITIVHGPRRLLARFILAGDRAARQMGLHLRVRHDFDALLSLNRYEAARGNWYPLIDMFNPESRRAEPGKRVLGIGRKRERRDRRDLRRSHLRLARHQPGRAGLRDVLRRGSRPALHHHGRGGATGSPAWWLAAVASWVRPDYRRQHLSRLIPRIGKAYACARWPIDWSFCYVTRKHVEQGLPASYGQRNVSYSISYPGTPWLDLVLAYSTADGSL